MWWRTQDVKHCIGNVFSIQQWHIDFFKYFQLLFEEKFSSHCARTNTLYDTNYKKEILQIEIQMIVSFDV